MKKLIILALATLLSFPVWAGKPTECNRLGYHASVVAVNRDDNVRPEAVISMLTHFYSKEFATALTDRVYQLDHLTPKEIHVDTYWWCMNLVEVAPVE